MHSTVWNSDGHLIEGWLYILSDIIIFLSCLTISFVILWHAHQKDVGSKVRKILYLFVAFIFLSGLTYLIDIVLFWFPIYRLSGVMKALTGIISLGTVFALVYVTPIFLKYKSFGKVADIRKFNEVLKAQLASKAEELNEDKKANQIQSNKLELALKAGRIGFWEWNLQSNYLDWNDYMFTLFDYDPKEFNHSYDDFKSRVLPEDLDKVDEAVTKSMNTKKTFDTEFRIKLRDGSIKNLTGMGIVLFDEKGKPWKMLGTNQDVTIEKLMHNELKNQNIGLKYQVDQRTFELENKVRLLEAANEDLRSFSYSISHDLRAPLRALSGFSDALYDNFHQNLGEKGNRWVTFIKQNATRMDELIDDILQLSRTTQQSLKKTTIDMNQIVCEVIEEIKLLYKDIVFDFRVARLEASEADPVLVRQLWHNLVSNAMKYSSKQEKPKISIDSMECDGSVTYVVKDNGVGFDESYKDKLFALFQRLHADTEFEGTGVGLTIAKKIIDRHQGEIWAESHKGEGASFYFSIPKSKIENGVPV